MSIQEELSTMILSASGWRKVFSLSGDEEDRTIQVFPDAKIIVYNAAVSFVEFLKTEYKSINTIIIGRDARPTGQILEDYFIKSLCTESFNLKVIGCSAAPEIMAYAKHKNAAFIYISASHNPIGHNGFKFGLNTGGVINAEQSKKLINSFKEKCNSSYEENIKICSIFDNENIEKKLHLIKSKTADLKKEALDVYSKFSKEVIANSKEPNIQNAFFEMCKNVAVESEKNGKPICILADFNGSARSSSIDRHFFEALNIHLIGIAEKVGDIRHAILPEGKNLQFCADKMQSLRADKNDPIAQKIFLGYMPDCDGDRGNIIYWNDELNAPAILAAQEVFAISVIAELAYLKYLNCKTEKIAIAVNGPTSLRIDEIAKAFNAKVFRAEVGEANVVNLATQLRDDGYTVRILGEGSNGGNITYPASVRDPINTIFAILKLLLIKDSEDKRGLFKLWCENSGQQNLYKANFSLTDVLATLPKYTTTPTGEARALLKIKTSNHRDLKRKYQSIFEKEWEKKRELLRQKFGITKYRAFCNNGTNQTDDVTDFGISENGGLKLQFYNDKNEAVGFIWMRGSGTEPVFRIMADIKGLSTNDEKYLVEWQGQMVKMADI